MAFADEALVACCRASYFISLLGLKIPGGLLLRASHARYTLAGILLAWIPFLAYCHAKLLPQVQSLSEQSAALVWHGVTAVWMTIPLLVVGSVILSVVQAREPCMAWCTALAAMAIFHTFVIPCIAKSWIGGAVLHLLFLFFEDMPIVGWVWCLYHVIKMQNHISHQKGQESPFSAPEGSNDRVLIVGNAPTVVEGRPLGALVDGFNHVVRFNSYSVDRPEFTGSKIGFHFCNGRNFPTDKTVKAICPLFNATLTHAVYLFMPHMEDAQEIYANLTSPKVNAWFVEEEKLLALRRKIGCRFWQIPTSGMVAIDVFLECRQQVTLHGFNFFQGKKIHYFEESPTKLITSWLERFVTHDPSFEKVWVEGLAEKRRIGFLCKDTKAAEELDAQVDEDESPREKKVKGDADDAELRKRTPGLVHTLFKDGFPSQFSL